MRFVHMGFWALDPLPLAISVSLSGPPGWHLSQDRFISCIQGHMEGQRALL